MVIVAEGNSICLVKAGATPLRQLQQIAGEKHGIGVSRTRGYDCACPSDPKSSQKSLVIQEFTGQPHPLSHLELVPEPTICVCRRQIERGFWPHQTGKPIFGGQAPQTVGCDIACNIVATSPVDAVKFRQLTERSVYLPKDHRGAGRCTSAAGIFAVDHHDLPTFPSESLSHKRPGNSRSNNQHLTTKSLGGRSNIDGQ